MNRPGLPQAEDPCPCGRELKGRPRAWGQCCGPYLSREHPVPDAESLMRSRYTAFVLGDLAWLRDSWHPDTRPADLQLDPGVKWLGLSVKRHRVVDAQHAEVEFVARSRGPDGRAERLHETSCFVRLESGWVYVDGDLHAR